jgi:hypothetical protein
MGGLTERIMMLSDEAVVEACKNLKLGLRAELQRRTGEDVKLGDADVRQALEALDLDGTAEAARERLLDTTPAKEHTQFGRALLLAVAQEPALAHYVEGAIEGADAGVRAIDPISILSIAAAVYLVGRLMPQISIKRGDSTVDIKPLEDPLKGLADLVRAVPVPFFRTGK